jgi:hypothetical protein
MKSTRTFKMGAKTFIITNVPDNVSNDELKRYALAQLYERMKVSMDDN